MRGSDVKSWTVQQNNVSLGFGSFFVNTFL